MTAGPATASFGGARVALLEARLADETAAMVRRLGGQPVSAPSVAETEVYADAAIEDFIRQLRGPDHVVVFLTGAAVARVFATADRLGLSEALRGGLSTAIIVARGPKPGGALARRGLLHAIDVPEPFTTADVLTTLDRLPVDGLDATVVHYGERNDVIVARLAERGARVRELVVYEWQLPADPGPLVAVIDALIAGEIPVLALTSQIQLRHLLAVAGPRRDALVAALDTRVIVGAVGPTCAAACHAAGISSVVTPDHPKLAPLLLALAAATARSSNTTAQTEP